MLDDRLQPLLIEANSNPSLETGGIILGKLMPELIDNTLMTAVDPLYPPPEYLSPHAARGSPTSTSARTTFEPTSSS